MREINFRGYAERHKCFVYGDFHSLDDECFIIYKQCRTNDIIVPENVKVIPTTVGQCTGLKDQNGTEIYEGDIIKYLISGQKRNGVVIWAKEICAFYMDDDFLCHHRHRNISDWMQKYFHKEGVFEVIGNIHENPEIEHLKIVEG